MHKDRTRKTKLYPFRIHGAGHVWVLKGEEGEELVQETQIVGEADIVLRGRYKKFMTHFGNFAERPVAVILLPVSENRQGQGLPLFVRTVNQKVRDIDMFARCLRTPGSPTYGKPKDEMLIQGELAFMKGRLAALWRFRFPSGEKLVLAPSVVEGLKQTLLSNTAEIFLSWEAFLFLLGEAKRLGFIDMEFDVREGDGWLPPPQWR